MSDLVIQCPGDTVQTGTGKVDPARKCTTAALDSSINGCALEPEKNHSLDFAFENLNSFCEKKYRHMDRSKIIEQNSSFSGTFKLEQLQ